MTDTPPQTPADDNAAARHWRLIFLGYFAFHALYRIAMGGGLGLDEAQMYQQGSALHWGYGPQLPLYAWLQYAVFMVTGPGLTGLAILKAILLASTALMIFETLRTAVPARLAGLATASLLLIPEYSWEAQRALTHSVLVDVMAAAGFAVLWRAYRKPGAAGFLLIGLVLGCGLLSKYNFLFLFFGLIAAAATLPQMRARLIRPGLLLSALVAAAISAKPILWTLQNKGVAFASSTKLDMGTPLAPATLLRGAGSMLQQGLGFAILAILVLGIIGWIYRRPAEPMPEPTLLERWMLRGTLIGLAIFVIGVFAGGGTVIRGRWLQPILILATPAAVLWLGTRIAPKGLTRLRQTYVALALLVVAGLPYHNMHGHAYRAAPFWTLAPELAPQMPKDGVTLPPGWLAGNLAYQLPDRTIRETRDPHMPATRSLVIVWEGTDPADAQKELERYPLLKGWTVDPASLRSFTAPYRFSSATMTLSIAQAHRTGD